MFLLLTLLVLSRRCFRCYCCFCYCCVVAVVADGRFHETDLPHACKTPYTNVSHVYSPITSPRVVQCLLIGDRPLTPFWPIASCTRAFTGGLNNRNKAMGYVIFLSIVGADYNISPSVLVIFILLVHQSGNLCRGSLSVS